MKRSLRATRSFKAEHKESAYYQREDAIDWGLTGPCLRGSGVDLDLRRDNPYTGYETYDFEIPVEHDCDVWASFRVRMRELYESHKICRQALERLKPGPTKADAPKVVLPDRDDMRKHMDSLIHHFLIVAEGFNVPEGEVYMPSKRRRANSAFI